MKEKPIFQTATWWVSTSSGIRLYASRLLGGNVLLLSSPPSTIDMILMILTYRVDVLSEDSAYKQFCFQSCMPVNCLGGMSCSFPLPIPGSRGTQSVFSSSAFSNCGCYVALLLNSYASKNLNNLVTMTADGQYFFFLFGDKVPLICFTAIHWHPIGQQALIWPVRVTMIAFV